MRVERVFITGSIEKPQISCLNVRTNLNLFCPGVFFDDTGDEETDDSLEVAVTTVDGTTKESQGRKDEG